VQTVSLRAWIIWLTAGLFYLFEFIHRIIISVMIPELSAAFDASVAAIGELSAYYFYAYACAQIPLGLLIDKFGTRKLLTLSCLIIAISSFIFGITSNLLVADVCRLFIGLGSASAFVGCLKIGSTWFPANKFGLIVGLTNLLGVTGAIIGGNPVARAVNTYGWRGVMQTSAVIGVILSFLLWSIVRDGKPNGHNSYTSSFMKKIRSTISSKQTWIAALFAGLMVAPIVTYAELWGVPFLQNAYNLAKPGAAQLTTITFLGIAIGGPSIGYISDKIQSRKLPMLIGVLGALVTISTIIFFPGVDLITLYFLHILFGFFSSAMLLCFTIISEAAKAEYRATAIGLTNCVVMAAGASLQRISGTILDASQVDFDLGFAPIIVCYILALISYKFINC